VDHSSGWQEAALGGTHVEGPRGGSLTHVDAGHFGAGGVGARGSHWKSWISRGVVTLDHERAVQND